MTNAHNTNTNTTFDALLTALRYTVAWECASRATRAKGRRAFRRNWYAWEVEQERQRAADETLSERIVGLWREAANAGDSLMQAIAARALGDTCSSEISQIIRTHCYSDLTVAEARDECESVLDETERQAD